jgi:hypothetical protein
MVLEHQEERSAMADAGSRRETLVIEAFVVLAARR